MAATRRGWQLILVVNLLVMSLTVASCSDEPTVLRIWQTETDKGAVEELQKTIKQFEKMHPGVTIELASVPWGTLARKLSSAIQDHNEPDIAHLEPFMVASVVRKNLLIPIDDVVDELVESNGAIYPLVLDLQLFNGKRYGIAYAIGITGWAYRKDTAESLELTIPETWSAYITFVEKIKGKGPGSLPVLLPGGDPLFIDQLFAELLANNGGRLFDPQSWKPLLDSKEVIETLKFFQNLRPHVASNWEDQRLLDQYNRLGREKAGSVPVTYGRASKAIEDAVFYKKGGEGAKVYSADLDKFALMPPPRGPSSSSDAKPIATIDCEPFVIFRSAKERGTVELSKDFLRLFFKKERYLAFVSNDPVHLRPIFVEMAEGRKYREKLGLNRWRAWAAYTDEFLKEPDRVRPILMPDISEEGRQLPFLLELQASNILTQAVSDVLRYKKKPEHAARDLQKDAEQLLEELGYRRW